MNYNKNLHKLLEILYLNGNYPDFEDEATLASFNLEELKHKLKLSKNDTAILLRNLKDANEITKPKEDTFVITHLGMQAFNSSKYLKAYRKSIIDNTKDIASILIPILSLIVAILAISLKSNNPTKEDFQNLQKKIEKLENKNVKVYRQHVSGH